MGSDEETDSHEEFDLTQDSDNYSSESTQFDDPNYLPWFDETENKKPGDGYRRQYQGVK